MQTFTEFREHLALSHDILGSSLLEMLEDTDGDITAAHTSLHSAGDPGHTHNPDGSTVNSQRTVLTDKSITMTDSGWSFDSTAQEALQELNTVINNRRVRVSFSNEGAGGRISGSLRGKGVSVNIIAYSFVDAVRIVIGEAYNQLDPPSEV